MAEPAPARRRSRPRKSAGREAARMAAVQALYQIAVTGRTVASVVEEFVRFRLEEAADGEAGAVAEPDREMFADIVRGVIARRTELDEMIGAALVEGWTLERMDRVLQAILRAGAYELFSRADVPPRVAITQYVDIAHAFFEGREPAFVNGVLDRLARTLRPDAFEDGGTGQGPEPGPA